jgi:hypothetical protein
MQDRFQDRKADQQGQKCNDQAEPKQQKLFA